MEANDIKRGDRVKHKGVGATVKKVITCPMQTLHGLLKPIIGFDLLMDNDPPKQKTRVSYPFKIGEGMAPYVETAP